MAPCAFKVCADPRRNRFCHQDGNSIAHLLVLRHARPEKLVGIGEGLEARRLTHRKRTLLVGQENGSPVRITFRHDGSGEPVIAKSAVTLCMIGLARALHALGQQLMRNVAP